MTLQRNIKTVNKNEIKMRGGSQQIKTNSQNKRDKCISNNSSPRQNSEKNQGENERVYLKIGEVLGRDKLREENVKSPIEKRNSQGKIFAGKNESDDEDLEIHEGTSDDEKKQWVEEYLKQLQKDKRSSANVTKLKRAHKSSDSDTSTYNSYCSSSNMSYRSFPGSDIGFINTDSPYIISNIKNFSKKNHSFNDYETWKIRRDNLKICEKIKSMENKISDYHQKEQKSQYFRNSKAINRMIENRRISEENMILRYMINKIKRTTNKNAPWYNPRGSSAALIKA